MSNRQDRVVELTQIYEKSGLRKVLEFQWVKYVDKGNFTKLQFAENDWHIRSIEIHETLKGAYFRIHHLERVAGRLKEELNTLAGSVFRGSNKSGTDLEGDFATLAEGLADVLKRHK